VGGVLFLFLFFYAHVTKDFWHWLYIAILAMIYSSPIWKKQKKSDRVNGEIWNDNYIHGRKMAWFFRRLVSVWIFLCHCQEKVCFYLHFYVPLLHNKLLGVDHIEWNSVILEIYCLIKWWNRHFELHFTVIKCLMLETFAGGKKNCAIQF
jgi:hypothetical protein